MKYIRDDITSLCRLLRLKIEINVWTCIICEEKRNWKRIREGKKLKLKWKRCRNGMMIQHRWQRCGNFMEDGSTMRYTYVDIRRADIQKWLLEQPRCSHSIFRKQLLQIQFISKLLLLLVVQDPPLSQSLGKITVPRIVRILCKRAPKQSLDPLFFLWSLIDQCSKGACQIESVRSLCRSCWFMSILMFRQHTFFSLVFSVWLIFAFSRTGYQDWRYILSYRYR